MANDRRPLRDSQMVRIIIDGVHLYVRVRQLHNDPVLRMVLAAINAERATGPCIGLLRSYRHEGRERQIQIDVAS